MTLMLLTTRWAYSSADTFNMNEPMFILCKCMRRLQLGAVIIHTWWTQAQGCIDRVYFFAKSNDRCSVELIQVDACSLKFLQQFVGCMHVVQGRTCLHHAVHQGYSDLVHLLLQYHSDVSATNNKVCFRQHAMSQSHAQPLFLKACPSK